MKPDDLRTKVAKFMIASYWSAEGMKCVAGDVQDREVSESDLKEADELIALVRSE